MNYFDGTYPFKPQTIRNQTYQWMGSDTPQNYRNYLSNPYTTDDISYSYNEYGFRSDSFIFNDIRMVFLGCSYTEGIGLPSEETFSYQIYQKIKKEIGREFPYWNLGLSGCGLDSIVRCYQNMHDLLKPQVIIALFPNYRLEFFEKNEWQSVLPTHDPNKILARNPFLINSNFTVYNTEKNLTILDILLEKHKTLLIWDTWDKMVYPRLNLNKLNNFKHNTDSWLSTVRKNTFFPKARDGMHYGKKCHLEYANIILEKFGNLICQRLTEPF